mmetsp:Transcript_2589/g.8681  ORF Transcript_2589/g.8681 Transcript_2589/m.8681 type:complete len:221 (-) Transcript_2589:754-1416(-)
MLVEGLGDDALSVRLEQRHEDADVAPGPKNVDCTELRSVLVAGRIDGIDEMARLHVGRGSAHHERDLQHKGGKEPVQPDPPGRLVAVQAAGALRPALGEVALDIEAQAEHQEGHGGPRVVAVVGARRVDLRVAEAQHEAHAGSYLCQGHKAHGEPRPPGRVPAAAALRRQRRHLRDEHRAAGAQHGAEAKAPAEAAAPDQAEQECSPEENRGNAVGVSHP